MEYRVCRNFAPHQGEWWTVERLERRLFRKRWWPVRRIVAASAACGVIYRDVVWQTEQEARAWVEEDKRPRIHECKPA